MPCGTLCSATQTGLNSVADWRKISKSLGIIALSTIVTSKYRLGIHIRIHAYTLHLCGPLCNRRFVMEREKRVHSFLKELLNRLIRFNT